MANMKRSKKVVARGKVQGGRCKRQRRDGKEQIANTSKDMSCKKQAAGNPDGMASGEEAICWWQDSRMATTWMALKNE